jgi:hypothetical protein
MKLAVLLSCTLVAGSTTLAAQSANMSSSSIEKFGPNQTVTVATVAVPSAAAADGCPVSLRAQQGMGGDMRTISSRPAGIAQLLHLTISNRDSKRITGASVTVRGLTSKGRMVRTVSAGGSTEAAKTLDVGFSDGSGKESVADLWAPGLTSVQFIDVHSVTYADGSTWKLASGATCHIRPDWVMLVSSR